LIRREVIEALGLSVSETAKALGVGRPAVSALQYEKAALTSDMALRIEKAFGPKMEHLMRMQLAYDLAQARGRQNKIKVHRYAAA
jgi:addiction module HigA family antidote